MKLHENQTEFRDLLYTDEKQDFDVAVQTFEIISALFAEIGE